MIECMKRSCALVLLKDKCSHFRARIETRNLPLARVVLDRLIEGQRGVDAANDWSDLEALACRDFQYTLFPSLLLHRSTQRK